MYDDRLGDDEVGSGSIGGPSLAADPLSSSESVEYDAETDTHYALYDSADQSPSIAVISVVAGVLDRDPGDLERMYGTVDPEALDSLLQSSGTDAAATEVRFRYAGCDVTVGPERIVVHRTGSDGE
jgi:hypothetical protein